MACRRWSDVFRAVLLCWVLLSIGQAEPVPDFAINAAVNGSATVSTLALETKVLFQTIGGTVVVLQAGYQRLADLKTAMTTIANQISTAGVTLTQAISTLALNNSGPIATYFDRVSSAIQSLQALVSSGLTLQLNTVNSLINNYVTAKLGDSFRTMSQTLSSLSQAVTNLRAAVQSARTASGTSVTVSATNVRRYVTSRVISDITNAVRLLKSDLPILVYIIRSTLGSIQTADEYLKGIADELNLRVSDVNQLGISYNADVNDVVSAIKTSTAELVTAYSKLTQSYGVNLQSTVETDANFKGVMNGLLARMATIFNSGTPDSLIDSIFATYLEQVLLLNAELSVFYGTSMCSVIKNLLQVLIENGPNAQFCFSKYGQKVFNFYVLHTYDSADCYRLQLTRLDKLRIGLFNIVQLVLHDIDDFLDNVERCTLFNDIQNCVTYLGTEYQTLLTYTTEKSNYITRLLRSETDASRLRMDGCFSNSKHLLIMDAEQMLRDLDSCELNGPM